MRRERYPGEQRGLSLFLDELLPVVGVELGQDHLLFHAIRRALRNGTLDKLRHARRLFNNLPRDQKNTLSQGLVGGSEETPTATDLLEAYSREAPQPYVCFDSTSIGEDAATPLVRLRHELVDTAGVRVMVRPGTLPSDAAAQLRSIASVIEADRRLLSERFWEERAEAADQQIDDSAERR